MPSDNILATAISLCDVGDSVSRCELEIDNEQLKRAGVSKRERQHALYEQASLYYSTYGRASVQGAPLCEECEVPLVGRFKIQDKCPRCQMCSYSTARENSWAPVDQRPGCFENGQRVFRFVKHPVISLNYNLCKRRCAVSSGTSGNIIRASRIWKVQSWFKCVFVIVYRKYVFVTESPGS